MRRRELITLICGAAAAWPLAARAQQANRMRRIGVVMYAAQQDQDGQARLAAFVEVLRRLGWTEASMFGLMCVGVPATTICIVGMQPNWCQQLLTLFSVPTLRA